MYSPFNKSSTPTHGQSFCTAMCLKRTTLKRDQKGPLTTAHGSKARLPSHQPQLSDFAKADRAAFWEPCATVQEAPGSSSSSLQTAHARREGRKIQGWLERENTHPLTLQSALVWQTPTLQEQEYLGTLQEDVGRELFWNMNF